jgi:hypothetical protein
MSYSQSLGRMLLMITCTTIVVKVAEQPSFRVHGDATALLAQ